MARAAVNLKINSSDIIVDHTASGTRITERRRASADPSILAGGLWAN